MHRSHSCQEATGKVFFLGEGGGMCTAPSDTRSEGWVSTSAPVLSGSQSGQCCTHPAPYFQAGFGLRQAGQSLGLVGPVPVYADMPSESVEVFNKDLLICT